MEERPGRISGCANGQQIPRIVVDPSDPNRLFGRWSSDIPYRFQCGARRVSLHRWRPVIREGSYIRTKTPEPPDIELDPSNPGATLYASLWEGRQGPWENRRLERHVGRHLQVLGRAGATWHQLTKGLPAVVQAYVRVSPGNPRRLYATVADQRTVGILSFRGCRRKPGPRHHHRSSSCRGASEAAIFPVPGRGSQGRPMSSTWQALLPGARPTVVRPGPDCAVLRGGRRLPEYLDQPPPNPDIILLASDQGAVITVNRGQTWSSWYNQPDPRR